MSKEVSVEEFFESIDRPDFVNSFYPCKVKFQKYFLSGLLEGLTITERMGFVSWDDACRWAGEVTLNPSCNFVVLEMTDMATGETERF